MMTPISRECPVLPKDLIIEILSRSPVKTLLRFKSISKSWQAIINSSRFQYQHFRQESNYAHLIVCWCGYFVTSNFLEYPSFESVGSISLFSNGVLENTPVELQGGLSEGVVSRICGPCNGIICVNYSDDRYALWNPATRKSWPIPEHPYIVDALDSTFSFFVNPVTNEFKIFWITSKVKREHRPYNFITYSSSNNSWSQIDPPVYEEEHVNLFICRNSITNGFFYFWKLNGSTGNYSIIGYDISNELFDEIHMPEVEIGSRLQVETDVYGDSLALFISDVEEEPRIVETRRTEIWIMKERGCWTKLFDVNIHNMCQILGFWKGNEFFISRYIDEFMDIELGIYDPLSDKTRKFEVEKVEGARDNDSFPICYKESLLSVREYEVNKLDCRLAVYIGQLVVFKFWLISDY